MVDLILFTACIIIKYGETDLVIYKNSPGYSHLRALHLQKRPLEYDGLLFSAVKRPDLVFIPRTPKPDYDTSEYTLDRVKNLQYGSDTD